MPLTAKGEKILRHFQKEYGPEQGKRYFYASANSGKITGVHDRARDMDRSDWRGGLRWLLKFFAEEMAEPEHQEEENWPGAYDDWSPEARKAAIEARQAKSAHLHMTATAETSSKPSFRAVASSPEEMHAHLNNLHSHIKQNNLAPHNVSIENKHTGEVHSAKVAPHGIYKKTFDEASAEKNAAGVMFVTKDGQALFLRRSGAGDHEGEWTWPGGNAEGCETPLECALREIAEETGHCCEGHEDGITAVDHTWSDDSQYVTFGHLVDQPFEPKLNAEHSEYAWRPVDDPPQPLHPGVKATLDNVRKATQSETGSDEENSEARAEDGDSDTKAADIALAMDRAPGSARSYDSVGRLHVDQSNISKATINPYRGDEIPDHEKLGLDPRKTYQLLRHPDELAKAAHSFNNLPVLIQHRAVSADDYQPDLVVGSTGTDAEFKAPYLTNSLVVWAKPAIDEIENGDQQQLSCSYGYTADMTPGEYEGKHYDGVMRNIVGNHVALVREGRAGPDVMVGDSLEGLLMTTVALSPKAALTKGALMTYLRPKLAADAKIDLNPIVEGVTAENFHKQRPIMVAALKMATRGRLAHDADIEDLSELLEAIEAERGADETDPNAGLPMNNSEEEQDPQDIEDKILDFLEDKVEPEHLAHVAGMMRADNPDDENEEEKEDRSAFEQRAADARVRLGRDETEEECERREMRDRAADVRRRLGRDESEEERRQREEGERCARDAHRAFRLFRHARDALYAHRRASDRKGIDRGWRAHDKKLARDVRTARGLLRQRRAADRSYRLGFRKRAHDQMPQNIGVTQEEMNATIARSIADRDQMHREAREAEKFVRPIVGELAVAYDSAQEVYRAALLARNVDIKGIHPSAYRPLLEAHHQQRRIDRTDTLGMDAKSQKSFEERYPGADRIQTM